VSEVKNQLGRRMGDAHHIDVFDFQIGRDFERW
jgi:hypothetical protein